MTVSFVIKFRALNMSIIWEFRLRDEFDFLHLGIYEGG